MSHKHTASFTGLAVIGAVCGGCFMHRRK